MPRQRSRAPWVVLLALVVVVAVTVVVLTRESANRPGPASQVLVGAALHDNGDPGSLERAAGARLEVHRTFWDAGSLAGSVVVARHDVAAGRVPLLSYKVGDWRAASEGSMDAWARTAAERLSALGGRVMLAIHHEPEDDGDIRWWTRMQQRLAPFFDRPHLEYGIILTGYAQFYGPPEYALPALWPTGAPIRFLGLDVYQSFGAVDDDTGQVNKDWIDMDTTYFAKAQAFCREKGIAWGLAETGITDEAFDDGPRGRRWFSDTVDALGRRGGSFFAYFDSRQNSGANTWPLHGAKREAFLRVLADARSAGPPRDR